jgi:hypothetical protein
MKPAYWGIIMTLGIVSSVLPIACASSRDGVARPTGATGDASDGLLRRDDSMEIPCEPRRVLVAICQQCHTRPETKNGAPFPLQWRSDVIATYGGVAIRELMIEQLAAGRMPLAPVTIDPADRETLLAWLRAGAPAVTATTCIDAGTAENDAGEDGSSSKASEDAGDDAAEQPDGSDIDAGSDGGTEEAL